MNPAVARLGVAFALGAVVASCGGSGGGDAPAQTPPPALRSGQLDASFGAGGKVTYSSSGGIEVAADGNLLVAGPGPGIAKLDSAGATVNVLGQPASYQRPVLDAEGNLYAVTGMAAGYAIAKFDPAGQRVASFGIDGLAILPSASNWVFDFHTLVRDPVGNLYLVGTRREDFQRSALVAKFDRDGRRVESFGSGGVQLVNPGGRIATGLAAAPDSQGNLFVAGWAAPSSNPDLTIFVAKLGSNGAPVAEFGADSGDPHAGGFWLSPQCAAENAPAILTIDVRGAVGLASGPGGAVLVGGRCRPAGSYSRPVVFRLDAGGSTDREFRDSGLRPGLFGVEPNDEAGSSAVSVLRFGPDGEVYAGGTLRTSSVLCGDYALAKLSVRGEPVPGFGGNGSVILDVAGDGVSDVALGRDGRLYLAGPSVGGCPTGPPFGVSFTVFRLGS